MFFFGVFFFFGGGGGGGVSLKEIPQPDVSLKHKTYALIEIKALQACNIPRHGTLFSISTLIPCLKKVGKKCQR